MKKHLKIEYNETVLFDGEVDEVVWNDGVNGVTVTGRNRRAGSTAGGGSALIDLLSAAARKQRTESGQIGQPAPPRDQDVEGSS